MLCMLCGICHSPSSIVPCGCRQLQAWGAHSADGRQWCWQDHTVSATAGMPAAHTSVSRHSSAAACSALTTACSMDVLAGRKTQGTITGEMRVDGHLVDQATFARICGSVPQ